VVRMLVAAALAAMVAGVSAQAQESRLDRVLERGTLRVGTTGDFKPMSFKNPASGDYEGYDIDAVRRLADDMGVRVEWVATDWKTLVAGVVADKYDLTTSASLSVDRAKVAGFSDPYVTFSTVPVVRAGDVGGFDGWDDLDRADVRIAVTLGTVFEQQARAFFDEAEIVTVEAPARGYQEVIAGRATATITSNVDAAELTTTYAELAVLPVEEARAQRPGAFLVPRDDQVWINFINHWIALRHADGFFDERMAAWNIAR